MSVVTFVSALFDSILGKKKTDGPTVPEKMFVKDKRSSAGGAVCLPAALLPGQDGSGGDNTGLDSKPRKGIIFEICSEDGFHIRSESIEGESKFYNEVYPHRFELSPKFSSRKEYWRSRQAYGGMLLFAVCESL